MFALLTASLLTPENVFATVLFASGLATLCCVTFKQPQLMVEELLNDLNNNCKDSDFVRRTENWIIVHGKVGTFLYSRMQHAGLVTEHLCFVRVNLQFQDTTIDFIHTFNEVRPLSLVCQTNIDGRVDTFDFRKRKKDLKTVHIILALLRSKLDEKNEAAE